MKTNSKEVKTKKFSVRNQEELEIVDQIKAGDSKAYEQIYNRYFRYIQYQCFMSTRDQQIADDLAMEILTKIYFNLDKYSVKYTFNSWVSSIAKNHLLDYLRRKHIEPVNHNANASIVIHESRNEDQNLNIVLPHQLQSEGLNPEELLQKRGIQDIRKAYVINLLNGMGERERMILIHFYFDEMSYEEISKKLNLNMSVMKSTLKRSKEKLKAKIGNYSNIAHLFA